MIQFDNPELFHLFWLVALLIAFFVWLFRYKRKLLSRLGDEELINKLVASVSKARQRWKIVLLLAAICFLIFALINPQIGTRLEEVKREGVDVFVAVDVSKSMLAEDIAPNRIEKARHGVANFISRLEGDRIGLIAFSGIAFVQCPLTLDYSAAKLFLDEIEVGIIPQPGTAIAEAIRMANRSFVKKDLKHKVLVLITDGEDHEGDPLAAAAESAKEGVKIFTIGIGSLQGAPIPEFDDYGRRIGYKKDRNGEVVTTKLDVPSLEEIALETGGKFYISSSAESELDKVYDEIASMEKKELGSREFTQFEDRFQYFLAVAFLLLLIEFVIGERKRRQIRTV